VQIISVVGARPQFVKLAAVDAALRSRFDHVIVHTGQHYDEQMSAVFFSELGISVPTVNLGVGSGKHGAQTAAMLAGLEETFEDRKPQCVLIYGDTNSTLAAAIAATKLHIPVAHLEAGLRSFNRRMPEEHNRVLSDHASDLCLAPTEVAMGHLEDEGLADRSVLVGDVMTDVLFRTRDWVLSTAPGLPAGVREGDYYLCTIHRPDNTDVAARLEAIVSQLDSLDRPVLLLAHPRLKSYAARHDVRLDRANIRVHHPVGYKELVRTTMGSAGVITDSGGLQKEAFLLRIPCTTVRAETEWIETISSGWNVLANDTEELVSAVQRPAPEPTNAQPYGDGRASAKVVSALVDLLGA
jgi:UDP-N-acetylglucosamine 2-epimerase (non-hydrolysing)